MSRRKSKSEKVAEKVNEPYSKELPRPKRIPPIADGIEAGRLMAELKELCPAKYDELMPALRKIVAAQRVLNGDERPSHAWTLSDELDGERVTN